MKGISSYLDEDQTEMLLLLLSWSPLIVNDRKEKMPRFPNRFNAMVTQTYPKWFAC